MICSFKCSLVLICSILIFLNHVQVDWTKNHCINELNKDHKICLSDETSSNDTLSIVILASVALRVSGSHFNEYYDSIKELAYPIFANVMSIICESQPIRPKQYCTIPQILYYIYKAVC